MDDKIKDRERCVMAKFSVPVTWVMWGNVEVEADSVEEAIELAYDKDLPKDGNYLEHSFEYDDTQEVEEI